MGHDAKPEAAARRHVTDRCLIAADVDKTILAQTTGEKSQFLLRLAPQLVDSAEMGMNLAFFTGNSMSQLANRFLRWLIDHLCHTERLELLPQFHFFSNSGGVYFRFPDLRTLLPGIERGCASGRKDLADRLFYELTKQNGSKGTFVRPTFVDASYIGRTEIPDDEAREIKRVLADCGRRYLRHVKKNLSDIAKVYDISSLMDGESVQRPLVELRPVEYSHGDSSKSAMVQLTLKPILSFRHAPKDSVRAKLFEKDLRTKVILDVQEGLDSAGLGHYVARAGGRSSIDVTLEKLDKAYALEFLIDSLNLQGHARQGQQFGANAIYFGDEVIVGGGNDYAVTRIPGLLVFAVNSDKCLIPFLSHVFVPSSILEGPDATADVLGQLNRIARDCLKHWKDNGRYPTEFPSKGSAIDCFKVRVFGERIHSKIDALKSSGRLRADEWQILHAFVTLMHRQDESARHWLAILVDELDAIMTQLSESRAPTQPAIGSSHRDN